MAAAAVPWGSFLLSEVSGWVKTHQGDLKTNQGDTYQVNMKGSDWSHTLDAADFARFFGAWEQFLEDAVRPLFVAP